MRNRVVGMNWLHDTQVQYQKKKAYAFIFKIKIDMAYYL